MALPGWRKFSWGYHGDDGKIFMERGDSQYYVAVFGQGNIVGCGVDWEEEAFYFTLNGKLKRKEYSTQRGIHS
jgi:hypothetical protein